MIHFILKVFAEVLFHSAGIERSQRRARGGRESGLLHPVGTLSLFQHLSAENFLHCGTSACLSDCVGRGALGTDHVGPASQVLAKLRFLGGSSAPVSAPLDFEEFLNQKRTGSDGCVFLGLNLFTSWRSCQGWRYWCSEVMHPVSTASPELSQLLQFFVSCICCLWCNVSGTSCVASRVSVLETSCYTEEQSTDRKIARPR